jgi:hypothetical protein
MDTLLNYKHFLKQGSYLSIHKSFIAFFGIECAALLSALIEAYYYYQEKNLLIHSDKHNIKMFYVTISKIEENYGISRKAQDKHINFLVRNNFIVKQLMGNPAKRHFGINEKTLLEFLRDFNMNVQNRQTSLSDRDKQECSDGTNSLNNKNEFKRNDDEKLEDKKPSPTPTFENAITETEIQMLEAAIGIVQANELLKNGVNKAAIQRIVNNNNVLPYMNHIDNFLALDTLTQEKDAIFYKVPLNRLISLLNKFASQLIQDKKIKEYTTYKNFWKHFSAWMKKKEALKS